MNNVAHTAESLETAKWLLDIDAVNFRPEELYKPTAGWASPFTSIAGGLFLFRKRVAVSSRWASRYWNKIQTF